MRKKLIIHSSLFSPFLQITIPIPFPIPNNPNQVITKFPVRKYLNEYKTKTWKFFRFGKEFDTKSNYYLIITKNNENHYFVLFESLKVQMSHILENWTT